MQEGSLFFTPSLTACRFSDDGHSVQCEDMETTWMSIDRGMDEDMAHVYSGILLSHKKEWHWVICRDVDGPRLSHTEWGYVRKEKQILFINACMLDLER